MEKSEDMRSFLKEAIRGTTVSNSISPQQIDSFKENLRNCISLIQGISDNGLLLHQLGNKLEKTLIQWNVQTPNLFAYCFQENNDDGLFSISSLLILLEELNAMLHDQNTKEEYKSTQVFLLKNSVAVLKHTLEEGILSHESSHTRSLCERK